MYSLNNLNHIKAVIFDMDNTLYDERIYYQEVFRVFSLRYGISFNERYLDCIEVLRKKSNNDIFSDWLRSIDFYTAERQEELFLLYQNIDIELQLYDDVIDILDFLLKKEMKIGILTNGVINAQKNKRRSLKQLDKYPFKIFYARANGKYFEKPHKLAFETIAKMMDVSLGDAIFIGDSLTNDICGAENAGMYGILLQRQKSKYGNINLNLVINNLNEIRRILE